MSIVVVACPLCARPSALTCQAWGSADHFILELLGQDCACDVAGAWDDVWNVARALTCDRGTRLQEDDGNKDG
jgi:hypothetical protein